VPPSSARLMGRNSINYPTATKALAIFWAIAVSASQFIVRYIQTPARAVTITCKNGKTLAGSLPSLCTAHTRDAYQSWKGDRIFNTTLLPCKNCCGSLPVVPWPSMLSCRAYSDQLPRPTKGFTRSCRKSSASCLGLPVHRACNLKSGMSL
jgi:hypothetical protein